LGWLAAHRLHPLERLFSKTVSRLPFWFLGFSFKALVLHQTIYKAQTLLEHTIFRRDFGPLKWVFATPGHHHRHHANERDCRDHSFAARLSARCSCQRTASRRVTARKWPCRAFIISNGSIRSNGPLTGSGSGLRGNPLWRCQQLTTTCTHLHPGPGRRHLSR
jgi:hypothetical protein